MSRALGSPKSGGRVKGTPNKSTAELQALADKLGVNPFEILLRFAANDWKSLGYDERTRTVFSKTGEAVELDVIEPSERIQAAKSACEYLFPKRKAVEFTGANGENLITSIAVAMKQIADAG
jgi:hypothetical protein